MAGKATPAGAQENIGVVLTDDALQDGRAAGVDEGPDAGEAGAGRAGHVSARTGGGEGQRVDGARRGELDGETRARGGVAVKLSEPALPDVVAGEEHVKGNGVQGTRCDDGPLASRDNCDAKLSGETVGAGGAFGPGEPGLGVGAVTHEVDGGRLTLPLVEESA